MRKYPNSRIIEADIEILHTCICKLNYRVYLFGDHFDACHVFVR